MRGLPAIYLFFASLFRNEFNKFNSTRARMLDSIYQMSLRLIWNLISGVKRNFFFHYGRNVVMDVITAHTIHEIWPRLLWAEHLLDIRAELTPFFNIRWLTGVMACLIKRCIANSLPVLIEMAKVINSGTRLIPDGLCFLDPLKELSILGNLFFRSMSV